MTTIRQDDTLLSHKLSSLPTRLCDWRISSNQETFSCGGDEVELSVWNTEQVFASSPAARSTDTQTKKRKRNDELFPGEIWRAKNVRRIRFSDMMSRILFFKTNSQVPNDNLGLRQPVHITSLTYLSPSSSTSHHHLLTGTQLGDVRRYDTRTARRPVANWEGIGKIGGVKTVEKGFAEQCVVCPAIWRFDYSDIDAPSSEAFVSDKGCNLFALDLRNGSISCGYKGTYVVFIA